MFDFKTFRAHEAPITRLRFTNCANYLISTSSDSTASVLSLTNVLARLVGPSEQAIQALAVSSGNLIATGSDDCHLCIYAGLHQVQEAHDEQFSDDYLDGKKTLSAIGNLRSGFSEFPKKFF